MGRAIAFADPLGIYIRGLRTSRLRFQGSEVPKEWVRFSRGSNKMPMRLEFGPSEDDPVFLDDITVQYGEKSEPLTGFSLAREIDVGPLLAAETNPRKITQPEFEMIPKIAREKITCGLPGNHRSVQITDLADLCESSIGSVPGTRGWRHDW